MDGTGRDLRAGAGCAPRLPGADAGQPAAARQPDRRRVARAVGAGHRRRPPQRRRAFLPCAALSLLPGRRQRAGRWAGRGALGTAPDRGGDLRARSVAGAARLRARCGRAGRRHRRALRPAGLLRERAAAAGARSATGAGAAAAGGAGGGGPILARLDAGRRRGRAGCDHSTQPAAPAAGGGTVAADRGASPVAGATLRRSWRVRRRRSLR